MDFQRLILFTGLALVLVLIWQAWILHNATPVVPVMSQTAQQSGQGQAIAVNTEDVPSAPTTASTVTSTAANEVPKPTFKTLPTGHIVVVETDLIRAAIDTYGGDLRRLELLTYPEKLDYPDEPFRLLNEEGADLFVIQGGLLGTGRQGELPNHHTQYDANQHNYSLLPDADRVEAVLRWQSPNGVVYRKVYTFYRNSYYIDIRYEIDNATATAWQGFLYNQILRTKVEQKSSGFGFLGRLPSYTGGVIYTPEDKYQKIDFDDMYEENLVRNTPSGWVAMLQHYFVGALLPQGSNAYEFYSTVTAKDSQPRYHIGYKSVEPVVVPAGGQGSLSAQLFVGPKEQKRLTEIDQQLELTVDYGWMTPISSPLFWLLTYIHGVVQNWGVSIILLTLLVKLSVLSVVGGQLQVDGKDEESSAPYENAQGAFWRRQTEIPASHDGGL